jgi:site-specific recombinase XerC
MTELEPVPAEAGVPALVSARGPEAEMRYLEFLVARIRSRNTRRAYAQAVDDFAAFAEERGIRDLAAVRPGHVGAWVEALGKARAPQTVKLRLAALRGLLDWLVVGGVIPTNPAASVRGPRHVVRKGRTPVLAAGEAQALIRHIDASTLVGRRDRALIGVMLYGLARVGAAVGMRVADVERRGHRHWIILREKGGQVHELPAHHNLEAWLIDYIEAAGIGAEARTPLFRAAVGRSGTLSDRPLLARNALHMVRRRCHDAGIATAAGCHSLRATGITAYLAHGGTLETAQRLAGHASPRTTQIYDRTDDTVTLDEIERIIV